MTRCSRHRLWPLGSDWALGRTLLGGEGGSAGLRQVFQRNSVTSIIWCLQDLASKRYSWFLVLTGVHLLENVGSRWSVEVPLNKFLLYCNFNVDLMMGYPRGSLGRCRMRSGSSIIWHISMEIGMHGDWGEKVTVTTCPQGQRGLKLLKSGQRGSLGGEWRPKDRI